MDTKGYYRAKLLTVCLRDAGLTESVTKQIDYILKEQFKPENYREMGGVAYFRNKWLELDLVHPPEIKEVEDSLDKFSHGDYSGLEKLSIFATSAVDFHEEHHGDNTLLDALRLSFNVIYEKFKNDPNHFLLPEDGRKILVETYKKLMGYYTIVPVHEHNDKPGFLGWFHVHPHGTKPSPGDINSSSNSDIPALLFSALPTYKKTGMQIYLLHSGKSELLYQGLLQPTQKQ